MDCNDCNKNEAMTVTVPWTYLEMKDVRYHVMVKRFIIALIIMAVIMLAEAGLFVWLWNQYDYTEYSTGIEAEQDAPGDININGNGNSNPGGGTQTITVNGS